MDNVIKLAFTGDIMYDNNTTMSIVNYSNFIDKNLAHQLLSADYTIGNLEVPIVDRVYENLPKYAFSAPIQFARSLKKSGIDFVSTANNHCLDCGIDGLIENIKNLDSVGIEHDGTYEKQNDSIKIFIKEIKNTKIAILSYTYGTNAFINNHYLSNKTSFHVNLLRKQEHSHKLIRKIKNKVCENASFFSYHRDKTYLQNLKNKINIAKKEADIVIACLHTGGQYNKKVEHYTRKLCNYVSKLGVDLIVANHPHVVLGTEKKNGALIFYSLGNFFATPFANHNQKDDFPDTSILLNIEINADIKKITNLNYSIVKTILNPTPICYNITDIYKISTKKEREHLQQIASRVNNILHNSEKEVKHLYKLKG